MADKKDNETPKEGEQKVSAEGTFDVEGAEGKTHEGEFAAGATVRSLKSMQGSEEAEEKCVYCGPITSGEHWSADCPVAQRQATRGADRPTAKATAPAPRAVAMSGRPD